MQHPSLFLLQLLLSVVSEFPAMHWTAEIESILRSSEDTAEAKTRLADAFGSLEVLSGKLKWKRTWSADAGETPLLHRAAFNGKTEHVKLLLERK